MLPQLLQVFRKWNVNAETVAGLSLPRLDQKADELYTSINSVLFH